MITSDVENVDDFILKCGKMNKDSFFSINLEPTLMSRILRDYGEKRGDKKKACLCCTDKI